MDNIEEGSTIKDFEKIRNDNNTFLFFSGLILFIIWVLLIFYAERLTIDRIIVDVSKIVLVFGCYFVANYVCKTNFLRQDKPIGLLQKGIWLIVIVLSSFAISYIYARNFSKFVEYFTLMVVPAFSGACRSISKDAVMTLKDRKQKRDEKVVNERMYGDRRNHYGS